MYKKFNRIKNIFGEIFLGDICPLKKTKGQLMKPIKNENAKYVRLNCDNKSLDSISVDFLRKYLQKVLNETKMSKVIIDISGIEYINSTAISCFIEAYQELYSQNRVLELKGAKGIVRNILSVTGVDYVIKCTQ